MGTARRFRLPCGRWAAAAPQLQFPATPVVAADRHQIVGGGRTLSQYGGQRWARDGATWRFGGGGPKGIWEWEAQADCRGLRRQHRAISRGRRPRGRVGGRLRGSGSSGIDGSIGQPRKSGCADWRNDGLGMAHEDKSHVVRWERSSGGQAPAPSVLGCAPGRNRWRA